MRLGIPIIVRDEQELLSWCLEGLTTIRDFIVVVSIVDNGSIDATPYIIEKYKARLPIETRFEAGHHHHGNLRNLALEGCRGNCDWILYVDSDETFTSNMAAWLASVEPEGADVWDFMKYSTINDHLHYVPSGSGPTTRMFRNVTGVNYVEPVHTKPVGSGLNRKECCQTVFFFDHTALKSMRGLWAKGWRYQEHRSEAGIGPPRMYLDRIRAANDRQEIVRLPQEILDAGIVCPPVIDEHLYAILASTITTGPCWLERK